MSAKQTYFLHIGDVLIGPKAAAFIAKLPNTKAWRIEITPFVKSRSSDQNAALFGVAYPALMEFMGLRGEADRQQLHSDLCRMYFGETLTALGFGRPKRTTTTNELGERSLLTTVEFADFYAFVQQTGAEHGCDVPEPDSMKSRKTTGDFNHD